jgi:hypothetical protein
MLRRLTSTLALAALASSACNAVFGIDAPEGAPTPGKPGDTTLTSVWGVASMGRAMATAARFGKDGTLYVAGGHNGHLTFGGDVLPYGADTRNSFFQRFDVSGKSLGGYATARPADSELQVWGLGVGDDGGVVIGGAFTGSLPGPDMQTAASESAFLIQKRPDQSIHSLHFEPNVGVQRVIALATDNVGCDGAAGSSVILVGVGDGSGILHDKGFDSQVDLGTGGLFVARIDSSGSACFAGGFASGLLAGVSPSDPFPGLVDAHAGIAVNGKHETIVAAVINQPVDFGGTIGMVTPNASDVLVMKFDVSGKTLFARAFGGGATGATDGDQWANGVAVDPASSAIYVTGGFKSAIHFGDGALQATTRLADDPGDAFVVKLDGATGDPVWLQVGAGDGAQQGLAIAANAQGRVAVASTTFDMPGTPGPTFSGKLLPALAPGSEDDLIVTRFTAAGALDGAQRYGGTQVQNGFGVAVDQGGRVAVAGVMQGTMSIAPGVGEPLVASDNPSAFVFLIAP